mgnify:CR=1 FL=1
MRSLIYILILFPSLIFSQTVGFKYQAVVRGPNGDLLVNQQISFKTTMLSGSAIGTEVFSETHTVGTNGYGVVNLNIGNGTAVSGSYSNIDWSSATHFLKTELDITGGSSYQFMGTSQILSVPYAEYAEMSGSSIVDNDTSSNNEIQQLSLVGNQLVLSNGGSVTLTGTVDLDADPSNELQSLSLSNDTLYLSQGNNVVLPPDSDGDATNELQALSLSNDTLYLTNGGYVVLPPDSDGDATNELQALSLSNDTLYLTSGGYVVLPPDSDGDATNELQALSLSNDTLYLTSGGYAVLPPDNDADTTNEIQALTNTAGTISITKGNTITLEDSSAINEIQVLSISNDTLYLTDGGFAVLPQELDSDTTNEIQTLSYSNDTLSISGGNSIKIEINSGGFLLSKGFDQSTSWTCPPNINKIIVELWGAGGGGGGGSGGGVGNSCGFYCGYGPGFTSYCGRSGGSGGSGGYNCDTINVIPSNSYNIVIGTGGMGGPYNLCGVGYSGYDGQSSNFNSILIAPGGIKGTGISPTISTSNYGNECTSCTGSNGSVINWKYSIVSNIPSYIPSTLITENPSLAPGGAYGLAGQWTGGGSCGSCQSQTNSTNGGDGSNGYCLIHY